MSKSREKYVGVEGKSRPDAYEEYMGRASNLFEIGDYLDALGVLDAAIREAKSPEEVAQAYLMKAIVYTKSGFKDEAMKCGEKAHQVDKNYTRRTARRMLGILEKYKAPGI